MVYNASSEDSARTLRPLMLAKSTRMAIGVSIIKTPASEEFALTHQSNLALLWNARTLRHLTTAFRSRMGDAGSNLNPA